MRRVLTALVLVPLVVYVVVWGSAWLVLAVTAAVALICYHEYAGIAAAHQFGSPGPAGAVAGLALLAAPASWTIYILAALTLFSLTWVMREPDLGHSLPRAAMLIAGVAYIFGCWKFAPLLHDISSWWLLYGLVLSWVGDIGAYYAGRRFGKRSLAPRISPKKSWEGASASVFCSTVFGVLYLGRFVPAVPLEAAIAVSVAANVAGQVGDLAESAIKRGAGVKDSGTILPGHGGFLDRVDSTLFALPVVYLAARLFA